MNSLFSALAQRTSARLGRANSFAFACLAVIVWSAVGPIYHYSNTWQLFINTGTTIVTFLMVFLIQNTQNRDMSAIQCKLDELIRVNEAARNQLLSLEDKTEDEIRSIKEGFRLGSRKVSTYQRHQQHAGVNAVYLRKSWTSAWPSTPLPPKL